MYSLNYSLILLSGPHPTEKLLTFTTERTLMNCDQSIHSVTNIQVKNHSVVDRRNPHVSLQSFNIYYNS